MRYLVTGAAGFIGFHFVKRLLDRGDEVLGVDCLSSYYDVTLKLARLAQLEGRPGFRFERVNIADREAFPALVAGFRPARVVNLAAQPSVSYSLKNPHEYVDSNLVGFVNVLEACRHNRVEHLVYASSSSVYGANTKVPFSVRDRADHPVSLYAATKRANELMAHTYSHLYDMPTTGVRFFTVYGPWGRPDMAYYTFAKAIVDGQPINLFDDGQAKRDFTYVDDVVEGLTRIADRPAAANHRWSGEQPDPSSSNVPFRLYNIGNNSPVDLIRFVEVLERCLGRKAHKRFCATRPGDVPVTFADVTDLEDEFDFKPFTSIETGLQRFTEWFKRYHHTGAEMGAGAAARLDVVAR